MYVLHFFIRMGGEGISKTYMLEAMNVGKGA